jgi:phosphatidylglycerophosphatase C
MSNGGGDVVVYDFDGTLVEGDIGAAFIHHLLQGWRRALVLPFAPLGFVLMRFEATRRAGVSLFLFFGALGRNVGTIEALAERFAETRPMRPRERELAWVRADVRDGHRVVVATGAFEPLARAALRRLGVYPGVTLVASRLRLRWGSAGVARHCTGEAKLRALAEEGFPPPYVRAVSDAAIDLPLLRAAHEAVLVNASARCRSIVRQALGARLVDADLTALPLP